MRKLLRLLLSVSCLFACLLVGLVSPARAQEGGPAPGVLPVDRVLAPVVPGDALWPLGEVRRGGSRCVVSVDEAVREPGGGPSFRVDYELAAGPGQCFAGLASRARRNLHKARGVEFSVRAEPPVAGMLWLVSSNPDDPRALDAFFGSFTFGGAWKTLRVPFRHMAPARGWSAREAAGYDGRPGGRPGDQVLRPDSVEELRIGLDPDKAAAGLGRLWVGGIGFFR